MDTLSFVFLWCALGPSRGFRQPARRSGAGAGELVDTPSFVFLWCVAATKLGLPVRVLGTWAWGEIQALELENVMDTPSFVFLWRAAGLCYGFSGR